MSTSPQFVRSAEARSVDVSSGIIRRTLGWGERMLAVEFTIAKGGVIPTHTHPHEQVGYVARGRLQFTVGDETAALSQGDGYAIPGGVLHSVVALEDSVAVDVFSPVREEYKS